MKRIWLDDLREMPPDFEIWCKTSDEAIAQLQAGGITFVDFDHDLGGDDTGYIVALWIETQAHTSAFTVPGWHIHSANPVGALRIRQAMESAERAEGRRSTTD